MYFLLRTIRAVSYTHLDVYKRQVVAGTFIIGALKNGMVIMDVNSYAQKIFMGIVLALAVGFDCYQKRKRDKA